MHGKDRSTKRGSSRTEAPKAAGESFDADAGDFMIPSVGELNAKSAKLAGELGIKTQDVRILRSPEFGALSRDESRNNSVIGSLISEELDEDSNEDERNANRSSRIYDVADIIEALGRPRGKVNADSRLVLLGQGYELLTHHPDTVQVNEVDMDQLITLIKDSKTDAETVLSVRFAAAYAATDSDEVGTVMMDSLIPLLYSQIIDPNTSDLVKSTDILAYFSTLLVIFDGSDCYSVSDTANDFLELVEGYQADKVTSDKKHKWDVVSNAINGISVVFTLLYKSGNGKLNELIEDCLPRVMPFLSPEFPENVHKSVCILIGLMYESYDYNGEGDGPYYDDDELKDSISNIALKSIRQAGKKSKREVRSLYQEVNRTIEDANKERDEEEEEESSKRSKMPVISKLAISRTKDVSIRSWFAFVRLIHLRYLFDSELSNYFLRSGEVRSWLHRPDNEEGPDDDFKDESIGISRGNWHKDTRTESSVKRQQDIRRARDEKLREEMDDLHL